GIPNELTVNDFKFLNAKTYFIFGDQDEYINDERLRLEKHKVDILFGNSATIITFDGKHEVNKEFINTLMS
ncbi:MAG: esterase, partial [Flavobacteriaceae bacterium]